MTDAPQRALQALAGNAAPRQPAEHDRDLVALVCAARTGDNSAWTQLVRRFDGSCGAIARSYRLTPTDVEDVVQSTWLDLLEDIVGSASQAPSRPGWRRRRAARRCASGKSPCANSSPMTPASATAPTPTRRRREFSQASAASSSPVPSPRYPSATAG